MKKLGIVTLYDDINIGNKLQNYAVQQFFSGMGFEVLTIPHWEMAHKGLSIDNIKLIAIYLIGYPKAKSKKIKLERIRKKQFKKFSDRYLKLGRMIKIKNLPLNFAKSYDYFVTGSDQVWHNWTKSKQEIDYFFLKFAYEYQRLTIAPSFGKEAIESEFADDYKSGILGIPFITCREKQGEKIVKDLSGKDATVILDPTMLIETEEWVKIEKKPVNFKKDKYVLVYALGKMSQEIRSFIDEISRDYSLKVIDIYNIEFEELYCTTPDEFIFYIRHAELIITDSFHASVFSILFKRNFIVFDRTTKSMGNMTSRLDTLLETFRLENRKYNNLSKNNLFSTDFSYVDTILTNERENTKKLYLETFSKLEEMRVEN